MDSPALCQCVPAKPFSQEILSSTKYFQDAHRNDYKEDTDVRKAGFLQLKSDVLMDIVKVN
jgi:hypothetical protein